MDQLKILLYTDSKYEYQADALIESLHLNGHSNLEVIYYTIGFESNLVYPNLKKKYWPLNPSFERFPFYKPEICLNALEEFGGNILFLDSDVIIGKRFNPDFFLHTNQYPLLSIGNWEFPFYFHTLDHLSEFPKFKIGDRVVLENNPLFGNIKDLDPGDNSYLVEFDLLEKPIKVYEKELSQMVIKDYSKLMKYYGVKKPTMTYVYSCCISFNLECVDFIKEWKSITENEYLRSFDREYYPIAEETSINVTLWKNESIENFGKIFVNTLYSNVVRYVEENEGIKNENIFGNTLQKCEDSDNVLFYHGMLDQNEIEQTLQFMRERSVYNI
jgi:hypothetical protein